MKQQSEGRSVETSGGLESNSFAIKTSPQAFQLLSSGLYTNKIQAVLRELGCNAVDAHQSAGCPERPIEVKLPNALDKQFYVKDYGTGLSHDKIMRLYTTYFDSTKQDSDDFIGGFGVGSKSPFAYTDSFTVESRFNGEKRLYSAYVNENGIPTIMQLSEEKTEEPNGLTIGFPVKPDDFNEFIKEAANTYKWFKVAPEIKGNVLKIESIKDLDLGKLWSRTYTGYYSNNASVIRMGSVAYPISTLFQNMDIENDTPENQEYLNLARSLLNQNNWVVDLPIGSSLVAASREALQFDKKSVASLQKALVPVMKEAVEKLHNELSKNVSNIRDYYKNIETLVNNTSVLNMRNPLFYMLHKHNPNYHPDGIKVYQTDYPALKMLTMSTSDIREFYRKTKQKRPTLDNDEIQRRVRRKITANYNENGKEPDYTSVTDFIWHSSDDQIKYWSEKESNDLQDIIDFTLADCNSEDKNKYVIIPADDSDPANFKNDLDKLCTYLNVKKEELVKPIRPPKKKMVKTEDIYGIYVEKNLRNSELSKLARQRMITSTLSTKVEPDSEYAYVTFDKKAFPHSKEYAVDKYGHILDIHNDLKKLKAYGKISDIMSEYIPDDGFIMIEQTDLATFKKICPNSKPLDSIINKLKNETSIVKILKKEADLLPAAVSYANQSSSWIKFHSNAKQYGEEHNLDLDNTVLHKTVSVWVHKQELADNTSSERELLQRASHIGERLLGWPKISIKPPLNTDPDINKLKDFYPMLTLINYYHENYEYITKYILDQEELFDHRNKDSIDLNM